MMIICAQSALQFKKPADSAYTGENYPSPKYAPLDNLPNEGDNAICYSESGIGMVDGESEQVGEFSFPAKYLSNMVAQGIFTSNQGLFTGINQDKEKIDDVKKSLLNAFRLGATTTMKTYRDILVAAARLHFYTLGTRVPNFPDILGKLQNELNSLLAAHQKMFDGFAAFKPSSGPATGVNSPEMLLDNRRNDIVKSEEAMKKSANDGIKAIAAADEDYYTQIADFKRKANTGLAMVAMRVTNNVEATGLGTKALNVFGYGKGYHTQLATLHGYQYGRSFVALFRRKKLDTIKDAATKKESYKYAYRMKGYHQHNFRDLYRVFPEVSVIPDPNLDKITQFSFDASEGDVVLVADATLVDNFSYTFIEYLMNLGISKMTADKAWNPEQDADLNEALEQFVNKMGAKNTLKRTYYLLTENPNFKAVTEYTGSAGVSACPLEAFYPAVPGMASRFFNAVKGVFSNGCLRKLSEAKFTVTVDQEVIDSDSDLVVQNFDPKKISHMFAYAVKKVQQCQKVKVGNAELPQSFLTYKQVISWRNQLALAKKDKTKPIYSMDDSTFEQMIKDGKFTTADGDLSLFVNILVKNAPSSNSITCTQISDAKQANFQKLLDDFFKKTTNLEIIPEDDNMQTVEQVQELQNTFEEGDQNQTNLDDRLMV